MATKRSRSRAAREPNLGSTNTAYTWSFLGVNVATFWSLIVSKGFAATSIDHFWARVTAKDGIVAASIPFATIVLTGVLSHTVKARLVFWRWNHPLPGCRAFTKLAASDPRIDVSSLEKRHGKLPQDHEAQNMLWYRIYKQHKMAASVWESQKSYLIVRDLAALAALFAIFLPIGAAAAHLPANLIFVYTAILVGQYLVIASAARNYGERFVLNVLAEDSQIREVLP